MQISALIIDDNTSNILVLDQLLRIEGVDTHCLKSTQNLTDSLNGIPTVDVVFLDLEIPRVNGYDAIGIIRNHPKFATTKVVAYSVHTSELSNVIAEGFDSFVGKPLNAEAFPDQLQRILRGEQVHYIP